MYCNESDFAKYTDDFYVGSLAAEVRAARLASLAALRAYAADGACRRRALLAYFGEAAPDCGKCDCCRRLSAQGQPAAPRDYTCLAGLLACAAQQLGGGAGATKVRPLAPPPPLPFSVNIPRLRRRRERHT
jgi:superfamily II DNA helicase RecQ